MCVLYNVNCTKVKFGAIKGFGQLRGIDYD